MTENGVIKMIHDYPALDEKWRAMSSEEKYRLVGGVLKIVDGIIGVAEIWAAMQTVKPEAEKTAPCGQCGKRRKLTGERKHVTAGIIRICGKCVKRNAKI